jgi:hypothetical protein
MITLERWENLSKRDQLGHIASEILRANLAKEKNQSIYLQILERAFYFIDLSLEDEKWRENPLPLLILRNELAKAYVGEKVDLEKIYMAI